MKKKGFSTLIKFSQFLFLPKDCVFDMNHNIQYSSLTNILIFSIELKVIDFFQLINRRLAVQKCQNKY